MFGRLAQALRTAVQAQQQAIDLDPGFSDAYKNLAKILIEQRGWLCRRGQPPDCTRAAARRGLRTALRLAPRASTADWSRDTLERIDDIFAEPRERERLGAVEQSVEGEMHLKRHVEDRLQVEGIASASNGGHEGTVDMAQTGAVGEGAQAEALPLAAAATRSGVAAQGREQSQRHSEIHGRVYGRANPVFDIEPRDR